MSQLDPRSFDIETTGLNKSAKITCSGFCSDNLAELVINCDCAHPLPDREQLETELERQAGMQVRVNIQSSEEELLEAIGKSTVQFLDKNDHYLTAFHGETWNGGFDLPFLRTRCAEHGVEWPFEDLAYVDVMQVIQRFNIGDNDDLESAYEMLIGGQNHDPFESSEEAVSAFENQEWRKLLAHNLADIQRTQQLVRLAERYVPKSDFKMKNLNPPTQNS